MLARPRQPLAAAVAIAAFAAVLAVASAPANELEISEQGFTVAWHPLNFIFAGTTSSCDLTLAGSFHELEIQKAEEALVGSITGASIANCLNGGAATVLTGDLPWHLVYFEFEGALPNIESVTVGIAGVAIRFDPAGITPACLVASEAGEPFVAVAHLGEGGEARLLAADETASIDLDNGFLCDIAGDIQFSGTGVLEGDDGAIAIELV